MIEFWQKKLTGTNTIEIVKSPGVLCPRIFGFRAMDAIYAALKADGVWESEFYRLRIVEEGHNGS